MPGPRTVRAPSVEPSRRTRRRCWVDDALSAAALVGSMSSSDWGHTPTACSRSSSPTHTVAPGAASASATTSARLVGRSCGRGPVRDSQLSAEYAARCWPWTIAQPPATGTRAAASTPGVCVPHPARPTSNAITESPTGSASEASWRRTCGPEDRQRSTTATTQRVWKAAYAGWARADQTAEAASSPGGSSGWGATTPADAYSTGQIAESAAQTTAIPTTATTTHRHRGEGRRPSGKQITESVVSARPIATGHTPSHPTTGSRPTRARGRSVDREKPPPRLSPSP